MNEIKRTERGQTLVIVALTITVLMLMAGLAVDVGMAYNERRDMQNAADAAALAGAQQLCDNQGETAAVNAAISIGMLNGATTITPTVTSGASARTVHAVASTDSETFFFRIVGINSVPVSTDATAECSCAASLGGAWPILFDDLAWFETLGCMKADLSWESAGQSPHFLVWADGNDDTYLNQDICAICDCSPITTGTGITTTVAFGGNPMTSGNRGWAQLASPDMDLANDDLEGLQCNGANTLKTWMEFGYPGLIYEGQCVPTETGTVASALDAAATGGLTDVNILLFDDDDSSCTAAEAVDPACTSGLLRIAGTGSVHIDRIYKAGSALTLNNLANNPFDATCIDAQEECAINSLSNQCINKTNQCLNQTCILGSTGVSQRKGILATKWCPGAFTGSGSAGGTPTVSCVRAVSLTD